MVNLIMEEQNKRKKNHWTQTKIDNATKNINQEIYKRKRQAPLQIKMDDMIIFINDKITRRGIAKGLVCIQEDINKNILKAEKMTIEAILTEDPEIQYKYILKLKQIMKIEIWTDIRFLMINKAITPGEITELIRRQIEIDKDINKWQEGIKKAISAGR